MPGLPPLPRTSPLPYPTQVLNGALSASAEQWEQEKRVALTRLQQQIEEEEVRLGEAHRAAAECERQQEERAAKTQMLRAKARAAEVRSRHTKSTATRNTHTHARTHASGRIIGSGNETPLTSARCQEPLLTAPTCQKPLPHTGDVSTKYCVESNAPSCFAFALVVVSVACVCMCVCACAHFHATQWARAEALRC